MQEWRDTFDRALEALVEVGALELRDVDGANYYAFHMEVDQNTWQPPHGNVSDLPGVRAF